MSMYEQAFSVLRRLERGFLSDLTEGGGDYGISVRYLRSVGRVKDKGFPDADLQGDGSVEMEDIQRLSSDAAFELYRPGFWTAQPYFQTHQPIATKLFCSAVNVGVLPANKLFQRGLAHFGYALKEDGQLGPKSMNAYRVCSALHGDIAVLAVYKAELCGYYRQIAAAYPKEKKHLPGWLNRVAL